MINDRRRRFNELLKFHQFLRQFYDEKQLENKNINRIINIYLE